MRTDVAMKSLRTPLTIGYGIALTAVAALRAGNPELSERILADYSTNLDNLRTRPVRALAGSAFVLDSPLIVNFPVFLVPLAISETRLGTARTAAYFAIGHLGATAVTTALISRGLRNGTYDESVNQAVDVGMSYGTLAVRFAAIGTQPVGKPMVKDAGRALALLALTSPWGAPKDFTATGHIAASVIGSICALFGSRRRSR